MSTELQVFIALGVVLTAVLVALVVDFLKGSNERLRERNVALSERARAAVDRATHAELHYAQMLELVETLKDAEQMKPLEASPPMGGPPPARVPAAAVEQNAAAGPELPDAMLVVETPTPVPESPVEVRVVRDEADLMRADEVIEEYPPLADTVAIPCEEKAPPARRTRRFVGEPVKSFWALEDEPEVPRLAMHLDVLLPEPATVVPAAIPLEAIAPGEVEPVGIEPVGIEPKETEASAVEVEAAPEETQGEALEAEPKVVEMPLPAHARADEEEALLVPGGIHPPEVLNALLRSEATFQGVTLSISVVDYVRLVAEHGKGSVEQVMGALEGLVQTSGNPADLVCRISEDEFIVVCPGATGAAATSRVQQLSENLWDFQLRSLVSFPILFSWGASESGLMPGMPRVLADSVDRAREQMLETRRSRRALTWESAKYGLRSNAG